MGIYFRLPRETANFRGKVCMYPFRTLLLSSLHKHAATFTFSSSQPFLRPEPKPLLPPQLKNQHEA